VAKRRGLGRGLDALLTGATPASSAGVASDGELRELPVDLIERGRFQPRTHFDPAALESLTESIRTQGVVQPVVVRPVGDGGHFELVAGERRWRAAQAAGLSHIPALVRNIPDESALAIALIENIQREDLNPIEEARALRRLIDEFDMTHQDAASAVGRSRAAVSNTLRLLELGPEVAAMVEDGSLEMGHARALLTLEPSEQRTAALEVVAKGLNVRATETLVRRIRALKEQGPKPQAKVDPDVRRLEDTLSGHLGASVNIAHKASGKGRINIDYSSLEELDGILERIQPGSTGSD
jgi:ParB family transcriptional regulator, chromosome partitioning protein